MSNHFFRVTSNGGYFGRFAWVNTGSHAAKEDGWWGKVIQLPIKGIMNTYWFGEVWVIRVLTH